MKKLLPLGIAALAVLSGCATTHSEAPIATNFAVNNQVKLQAASHWLLIAKDVANQIKQGTEKIGAPVYVSVPQQNSKFTQAFYNQIITSLVNDGVLVRKFNDGTAQVIDIETQLLPFSKDRHQNRFFISQTAIAVGLTAIRGLDFSPETQTGLTVGGVLIANDWYNWVTQEYAKGPTPQYELIVTTSLVKNSQYVSRRTDAYYIHDNDKTLYTPHNEFNFKVVGG